MAIKKTTTVETTMRMVGGKKVNGKMVGGKPQYFFRTAIPKDLGIEVLGLNIEKTGKQRITWTIKGSTLIVEAKT